MNTQSTSRWKVKTPDGERASPTVASVREWIRKRRVGPDDAVFDPVDQRWYRVAEHPLLGQMNFDPIDKHGAWCPRCGNRYSHKTSDIVMLCMCVVVGLGVFSQIVLLSPAIMLLLVIPTLASFTAKLRPWDWNCYCCRNQWHIHPRETDVRRPSFALLCGDGLRAVILLTALATGFVGLVYAEACILFSRWHP